MGKRVDIDQLIDAEGIRELLGYARRNDVSTYRHRHADFPAPALNTQPWTWWRRSSPILWLKSDILKWAAKHPHKPTLSGILRACRSARRGIR